MQARYRASLYPDTEDNRDTSINVLGKNTNFHENIFSPKGELSLFVLYSSVIATAEKYRTKEKRAAC